MDRFARINSAAHDGDFGLNSRVHPSIDQIRAGNYKKGRTRLYGLNVAIETPQGQRRTGKANGEPWSVICQAHYGYLVGTKAADGDPIDVYIGPWPEARMVYVINQNDAKGRFDEVKVMMAFPDAQSAKSAYLNSYERGWTGFGSMVACTVEQFKWWLKNGNTTVALSSAALPYDRTNENDTMNVVWDSAANPVGTDIASIIYRLRCDDSEGAMLDAINEDFIIAASDGEMMLDALVVPFAKVERKMEQMQKVMEAAANGVTVTGMQVTAPFKQRGTTNVAAIFELSDGQTVSIFMHNPDTNPNKLTPTDELISWKWLLNKKDITILVAPEKGEDLNVREVARRIMRVASANSAKFQAANGKRAERMAAIEGLKDQVAQKESIVAQLDAQIADLTTKVEAKRAAPKPAPAKTLTDAEKAALADKRDMLMGMLQANPNSPNAESWRRAIADVDAKIGPKATGGDKSATTERNPVDMTGWSDAAKLAQGLRDEYRTIDILNKRAVAAFKNKVRAAAKKIPEDDEKAVTIMDLLYTKVWSGDYDPKEKGLEFAPSFKGAVNKMLSAMKDDAELRGRIETAVARMNITDIAASMAENWYQANSSTYLSNLPRTQMMKAAAEFKSQATEAIIAIGNEIERAPVKPAPVVPDRVVKAIKYAVGTLQGIAKRLEQVVKARGHGFSLQQVFAEEESNINKQLAEIEKYRGYAVKNGATAEVESIIAEAGGIPDFNQYRVSDLEPFGAATAEDSSFIKTVIDGSADLYDKAVTDRLAALANQYKDGPMADLLKQAKTAAKKFFIAEFQKKTGG